MDSFDPKEWEDSEFDANSKTDAPEAPEANQKTVPVSVHFSSNWETVTTQEATFWEVTPSGSCSFCRGVDCWVFIFMVPLIITSANYPTEWFH